MGNINGVNYLDPTNHKASDYPNNAMGALKEGLETGKIVSDMRTKRDNEKESDDVMRQIAQYKPGEQIPAALMLQASKHFTQDALTAVQSSLDISETKDQKDRERYLTDMETNNELTGQIIGKMYDVPEEERAAFLQTQLASIENPDLRGYYTDNFLEMFREGDFSDEAMKLFSATLLGHDTWMKKTKEAKQRDKEMEDRKRLILDETAARNLVDAQAAAETKDAATAAKNADVGAQNAATTAGELEHKISNDAVLNGIAAFTAGAKAASDTLTAIGAGIKNWAELTKAKTEANKEKHAAKVLTQTEKHLKRYGGDPRDVLLYYGMNYTALASHDVESLNLGSYQGSVQTGGGGPTPLNKPPTELPPGHPGRFTVNK